MPHHRFGHFELLSLLGRGGMAEVFLARAVEGSFAGETVALKRLLPKAAEDPLLVDLFLGEAAITASLQHPGIVQVRGSGEIEGVAYLAMEYVDGPNLGHIVARCSQRNIPLPVDLCFYIAHKVAEALVHAHNAWDAHGDPLNLVHCDVNPANVFISSLGEVRLGDFGVARAGQRAARKEDVLGKVHYLAPETIQSRTISPAADVFALGVVLYVLLTGKRPFEGYDDAAVVAQIAQGDVVAPSMLRSELSPEQDRCILRALHPKVDRLVSPQTQKKGWAPWRLPHRKQEHRFATAQQFAEALVPLFDPRVGTPLCLAGVVRGLFGAVGALIRTPRFAADLAASLATPEGSYPARVQDLSETGGRLVSQFAPEIGIRLSLAVAFSQDAAPAILPAEVVWVHLDGSVLNQDDTEAKTHTGSSILGVRWLAQEGPGFAALTGWLAHRPSAENSL